MSILISDKIDFKTKIFTKMQRSFYNDKGPIHQEDVSIVNINTSENRAPKYMK